MKTFKLFGTEWQTTMEGNRIIHPKEPWQWYDDGQVMIGFDTAALTIEKKPNTIEHEGKTYHPQIATGVMRSVQSFGYGLFTAQIRLPKGKNLWPAFWLVGEGLWPDNGEIDIMEAYTRRQASYYRFPFAYEVTTDAHFPEHGAEAHIGAKKMSVFTLPAPSEHFVEYSVLWSKDAVYYYADGKKVRELPDYVVKKLQGTRQHVVFDFWTTSAGCSMEHPMEIRDFQYIKIEEGGAE